MTICNMIDELSCLIDLHLHLDGSVSVRSARELASIENVSLPSDDETLRKMLMVSDDCADLNEYLEKFSLPVSLMQSDESLRTAAYNLCCELKNSGFMYAEIRFAPQKHCEKGLTQEDVVRAVIRGISESGFEAGLILCCMRDSADNTEENLETVRLTAEYLGRGVCACDLAGAEALFPNSQYLYVFEAARKVGVPFTVHSGEALGYESVILAAENGASRIGHGVRAAEDQNTMNLLRDRNIALEICPTSNINTCVFSSISDIPLRKLDENGITVTVNTDNMSVSATDIRKELKKTAAALSLDMNFLRKLIENSVKASFTGEELKNKLYEKIKKDFE